jgi:hypothetical protein
VSILNNYPVTREFKEREADALYYLVDDVSKMYRSLEAALQAIHDAPHDMDSCAIAFQGYCTCWKAVALAAAARELGGEVSGEG